MLFGSRARGDQRPDSDWDIAFITAGDSDRLGTRPEGVAFRHPDVGQYVNDLAISEGLLARKALCIGHVGRDVIRNGLTLAGAWTRPKREGVPFMEAEKYERLIRSCCRTIERAFGASARLGSPEGWKDAPGWADDFVACTADAAEHLVKAMLGRRGIDPYHSHHVRDLADQARDAGHDGLADGILRMNGHTRQDHVARYDSTDPDRLFHAPGRLPVVVDLLVGELIEVPETFLHSEARTDLMWTAVARLHEGADVLRNAPAASPAGAYEWLLPLLELSEYASVETGRGGGTTRRGAERPCQWRGLDADAALTGQVAASSCGRLRIWTLAIYARPGIGAGAEVGSFVFFMPCRSQVPYGAGQSRRGAGVAGAALQAQFLHECAHAENEGFLKAPFSRDQRNIGATLSKGPS